jgi:hypothetical protein
VTDNVIDPHRLAHDFSRDLLEDFGRCRLSANFFMRDFLYSESAAMARLINLPPTLRARKAALANGRRLCEDLLEPLQARFGRLNIRSAYRSQEVNDYCNRKGHWGCTSNEKNFGRHIWDIPSAALGQGAMCCVVIPQVADLYDKDRSIWRELAWWIHDRLPYSELEFFPRLCAFNVGWAEQPQRRITTWIESPHVFTEPGMDNHSDRHDSLYARLEAI